MQEIKQANKELLESLNPKNFKCYKNNGAFRVCITPTCEKPSIMCRLQQCECQTNHQDCRINMNISKFLDPILAQLTYQIPQNINTEYQTMIKEINNIIDKLSQIRESLIQKKKYYNITQLSLDFIKLCQSKSLQNLKGKFTSDLQKQISNFKIRSYCYKQQIIKDIQTTVKNVYDQINRKISKIEDAFMFKNTKIINDDDSKLLYQWMTQTLNKNKIKFKFLYRASENEFSAYRFHEKCDNIKNTIVVAETEFGKKIGGFNPASWNSTIIKIILKQLLFFLSYHIYCNSSYGPTFGNGDLQISHQSNKTNASCGGFPACYKGSNNKYQNQNQQTYTLWSGATNGKNFKVKDYEVFEVLIEQ